MEIKASLRFIKNKLKPNVKQQEKTVFETVCEVLRKDFLPKNKAENLTKDTEFEYHLDLTSLDISELLISLEKIYGIVIDDKTSSIFTLGDVCNIVETKLYIKKTLDKNNKNFAALKAQILKNLIEILFKNGFVSEHKQKDVTNQSLLVLPSAENYQNLANIIKEKFDINIKYHMYGMKTVNDLYKFVEYKTFEKNILSFKQQMQTQISR